MKKLMIALSLAALFSGVANANEDSLELDIEGPKVDHTLNLVTSGQLNFSGSIFAKTCSIKSGASQNVQLSEVSNDQFSKDAYSSAGKKEFDIELVNCTIPQNKSVTLQFNPTAESVTENGYLNNTASINKSNVLIRLNDASGKRINLQPVDSISTFIEDKDEMGTIPSVSLNSVGLVAYKFSVEYVRNGSEHITPGNVEATLPFTISYK